MRGFSSKAINFKYVLIALDIACQAPSGANFQPWRFVIITDANIKRRIRDVCERIEKKFYLNVKGELRKWLPMRGLSWKKPFLEEAPILVLVLSEKKAPYSTQSVWLAIGYILRTLEELSLNTVTYTPSISERVLSEVGIPDKFRLEAILPIGISTDEKSKEPRFSLDKVTYANFWG